MNSTSQLYIYMYFYEILVDFLFQEYNVDKNKIIVKIQQQNQNFENTIFMINYWIIKKFIRKYLKGYS